MTVKLTKDNKMAELPDSFALRLIEQGKAVLVSKPVAEQQTEAEPQQKKKTKR